MAEQVYPWVFEQIGGLRKKLTLAGYDAPFGRPRQKAVARDKIALRHAEVYYPGNPIPTRHVFGTKLEPWDLNGRFSDRYGGVNYASDKVEFIKAFVADAQEVRIRWGTVLAVRGLIESFDPGRESTSEVEWKMIVLMNEDELQPRVNLFRDATETPSDLASRIESLMRGSLDAARKTPVTLRGDIFDVIDSLVSAVNSATASLLAIADQVDSFEKASIGEVRRFRAGLAQARTAIIRLRVGYDNLQSGLAIQSDRAEDDIRFWSTQSGTSQSTLQALLALDDADRAAAIAERGKIRALYTGKTGDTWEGISIRVYGKADRAGDLRAANGIPSGAAPQTCTVYQVPA